MIRKGSLLLLLFLAGCQSSSIIQFALIGDNPYQDYNFPKYERMIDDINSRSMSWVVHVGDMKDGGGDCSDESLQKMFVINQRFQRPFVVTPGDNDWFDCARESSGAYDRRERLQKLREIFYSGDVGLPVVRQPGEYVENMYWTQQNVMFATVHLVGITGQEGGIEIHREVMSASIEWMNKVFVEAKDSDSKGIFLATQSDIYPFTSEPGLLKLFCPQCPTVRPFYEEFHAALLANLKAFDKPVVLAVGDTHIFRVDKPVYDGDKLVEHFTRVETFGEGQVHWVRVDVDPASREVFSFHQEIIPANRGVGWSGLDKETR